MNLFNKMKRLKNKSNGFSKSYISFYHHIKKQIISENPFSSADLPSISADLTNDIGASHEVQFSSNTSSNSHKSL